MRILILIIFVLSACTDIQQQDSDQIEYENVDQDLWPFFYAFELAAERRGINIDLEIEEISGEISRINDEGVAGTCQYGTHISHVTIDQDFWNDASSSLREYVVFHELGHCFLNRGHLDQQDLNGNCLSIMQSGLTGCDINYSTQTRTYYLNELFNSF